MHVDIFENFKVHLLVVITNECIGYDDKGEKKVKNDTSIISSYPIINT